MDQTSESTKPINGLQDSISIEGRNDLHVLAKSDGGNTSMRGMCRGSKCTDIINQAECCSSVRKPHRADDLRWTAIQAVRMRDGVLNLSHFRVLKQLGSGDIGNVYLARLSKTKCYFALKVIDKGLLAIRQKQLRAQTEREILQTLDHPFLPTLYNHYESDRFSCLIMEFCPDGDLHALRHRQPRALFGEQAARFYAAEVLLAVEYLHMLGIVYRDLKPENILLREDGHIMLSDFDLSLRCAVNPAVMQTSSLDEHDSASVSCFPCLFSTTSKIDRKSRNEKRNQVIPLPEVVAEPDDARSMSFVGTHEYLSPEVIKGEGHGSAVDWWAFGVFLYELLYGKTPFKGDCNRNTLCNVIRKPLEFPESPAVSCSAQDLIRRLLVKDPQSRMGYKRGAVELKRHSFFKGVNWALIRCAAPPAISRPNRSPVASSPSPASEHSMKLNFFVQSPTQMK